MERKERKHAVVPILCIVLGVAFACLLFAKIIVVEYILPGRDPDGNFITTTEVAVYSFYMLLCDHASCVDLSSVFYSIFGVFVLTACFGIFGVVVHYDKLEKFDRFTEISSKILLIASCVVAFGCWFMSHYLISLA